MAKLDFKGAFTLALPVTLAVFVASWLFGMIGVGTTPLFSSVVSTVTPTIGAKALGFISGILPFQFSILNLVYVYISAFVALVFGTWVMTQFKLPNLFPKNFLGFNSNASMIASTLVWAAIPSYLLLVGFEIPSIMVVIGILIFHYVVGIMTGFVANATNFFKLK